MLYLSVESNDGAAEMTFNGQSDVAFTVTIEKDQYDFAISRAEWERLKKYIDDELEAARGES